MPKSTLARSITLLSSVSLVIVFLLYRTGGFEDKPQYREEHIQTSHNGGAIKTNLPDTAEKKSTKKMMLSSSKSIVLPVEETSSPDTLQKDTSKIPPALPKEAYLFSGSKSGHIFYPDSSFKATLESVLKIKKPKKKNKKRK